VKPDLTSDLTETIVASFTENSWACVERIVEELTRFKAVQRKERSIHFMNGRDEPVLDSSHFFLRASVEYSNPQLTLEEVQGIIASRLLEVCGNYFYANGLHSVGTEDLDKICDILGKPPQGEIVSFLLNTDEVEPDRYSINPLRESIVSSGQSAFPSAYVKTKELEIDAGFTRKYEGALITKNEAELIAHDLETSNSNYMDVVDAVKGEQLRELSEVFGIDLCISSMRLPITALEGETNDGVLHQIIREVHKDFDSIERAYNCMGRSIKNRTTLLTVPHSEKGYGSKRAARGKIYFEGKKLKEIRIDYKNTALYENEVEPADVSVAVADDHFVVDGERFTNYSFKETPSSPQFFLYSLGSPENAAIWHGIGVYAPPQLLKSYASIRLACAGESLTSDLKEGYGVDLNPPKNFNLVPKNMWVHPIHRNIDASVGCVADLKDLANMGIYLEYLPTP
jgi:hypothetical protein